MKPLGQKESLRNSLEVVWLSGVVIAVGDGAAGGHPEKLSLLALVGARRPEVLVAHADGLDQAEKEVRILL